MSALQKTVRYIAVLCLTVVAAFFVLEIFLRLLIPDAMSCIPMDRTFTIYSPEHNRQHPHSNTSTNLIRIAIIGDSITVGVGNQRYDRFAERLEWLMNLNDGVTPCEVEVFAKPTATYQQARLLQKAFEYKPSIILFIVHLNDTENWSAPKDILKLREKMGIKAPPLLLRYILKHSALVSLSYYRIKEYRQKHAFIKYYRHIYKPTYPGMSMFTNTIHEFHQLCSGQNVSMAVILFPLLNQNMQKGKYPFETMHNTVRDICGKENVPFLDLLDAYRFANKARDQNILFLDQHPNEIGHRIAADAIFHFLLGKSIVPDSYHPNRMEDQAFINKLKKKLNAMQIEY
ncbi:MAG: GDSL-type esterase/lipase family protein [Kiritimatiellae bacterium]|nr:GDSL-type esterase/lipase family protein [Kiritimatiellia bacterium]MDD5522658.1 GDSL-type esterase/lipase family protein [Kiritimatiellia bacterium]